MDKVYTIVVANGALQIELDSLTDIAAINAIEIIQKSALKAVPSSLSFTNLGGSGTLTVNADPSLTWQATLPSWMTTAGSLTATGSGIISYTAGLNNGPPRNGNIFISSTTATPPVAFLVPVSQSPCSAGQAAGPPIRISGGSSRSYTDSYGYIWAPDTQHPMPGGTGAPYTTHGIAGTADQPLYQTWAYYNNQPLIYSFPALGNGTYDIRLRFAELFWNLNGHRAFNILVNGTVLESNFDPAAEGTIEVPFAAHDKTYQVNVCSGQMTIELDATWDISAVNALEVLPHYNATNLTTVTPNQMTGVGQPFFSALTVLVSNASGQPVQGVPVLFQAPFGSGPGGTFAGSSSITVSSGLDGKATAPTFTANAYAGPYGVEASAGAISTEFALRNQAAPSSQTALGFIPIAPCTFATTTIAGGSIQHFAPSPQCPGIPADAAVYSITIDAVPGGPLGYLTVWAKGQPQPLTANLNSDGRAKVGSAFPIAGTGGAISVFATNSTALTLTINGYFISQGQSTLQYYPVTPCRLLDTRTQGNSLVATVSQTVAVASACGVPPEAQAVFLNPTVVSSSGTGTLTTWPGPANAIQSLTPTLRFGVGSSASVTGGALIAGLGPSGEIYFNSNHAGDLILDVFGYFGPPSTSGLAFFASSPCRAYDSRGSFFRDLPFSGGGNPRTLDMGQSGCFSQGTSSSAYLLNATVVPSGSLGYLTMWAANGTKPTPPTLNATDGAVTSNVAITSGPSGSITAEPTDATHLILDSSGYFGPAQLPIILTPYRGNVSYNGTGPSGQQFTVTVNGSGSWSLTPNASLPSWLTVTQAGNTVTYKALPNPTPAARTADITVTWSSYTATFRVNQLANPNFLTTICPTNIIGTGGSFSLPVAKTGSMGFTASSTPAPTNPPSFPGPWLTLGTITASSVGYNVVLNQTGVSRSGSITITPDPSSGLPPSTCVITQDYIPNMTVQPDYLNPNGVTNFWGTIVMTPGGLRSQRFTVTGPGIAVPVSWTVTQYPSGGGGNFGTITTDANSTLGATYTPATTTPNTLVQVTARDNNGLSASALVQIQNLPGPFIQLTTEWTNTGYPLPAGHSPIPFSAYSTSSINGSTSPVRNNFTWSVNPASGAGTVDQLGMYTPPASTNGIINAQITATSVDAPQLSGFFNLTVGPAVPVLLQMGAPDVTLVYPPTNPYTVGVTFSPTPTGTAPDYTCSYLATFPTSASGTLTKTSTGCTLTPSAGSPVVNPTFSRFAVVGKQTGCPSDHTDWCSVNQTMVNIIPSDPSLLYAVPSFVSKPTATQMLTFWMSGPNTGRNVDEAEFAFQQPTSVSSTTTLISNVGCYVIYNSPNGALSAGYDSLSLNDPNNPGALVFSSPTAGGTSTPLPRIGEAGQVLSNRNCIIDVGASSIVVKDNYLILSLAVSLKNNNPSSNAAYVLGRVMPGVWSYDYNLISFPFFQMLTWSF